MRKAWVWAAILVLSAAPLSAEGDLRQEAVDAMARAARFFRSEVATNGGYL